MLDAYDFNIADLKLFSLLAEAESLTEVSKMVGIQQPTVSRNLRRLESRIGMQLMERHSRKLELTADGHVFLEHAINILKEFDAAKEYYQNDGERLVGTLSIGAQTMMADWVAEYVLRAYTHEHPGIKIQLEELSSSELLSTFPGDILLTPKNRQDDNYKSVPLVAYRRAFFASPGYLENRPSLSHPEDMTSTTHCGVLIEGELTPFDQWAWVDEKDKSHAFFIAEGARSNHTIAARNLTIAGVGIGWLPHIICQRAVAEGKLLMLFGGKYASKVDMYATYKKQRVTPKRISEFIDVVKRLAEDQHGRLISDWNVNSWGS